MISSANCGAILTEELISIQKWQPKKNIKVVGSFDPSAYRDGHLLHNFVHRLAGKPLYMEIESFKTAAQAVVCQKKLCRTSRKGR